MSVVLCQHAPASGCVHCAVQLRSVWSKVLGEPSHWGTGHLLSARSTTSPDRDEPNYDCQPHPTLLLPHPCVPAQRTQHKFRCRHSFDAVAGRTAAQIDTRRPLSSSLREYHLVRYCHAGSECRSRYCTQQLRCQQPRLPPCSAKAASLYLIAGVLGVRVCAHDC